MADMIINFNGGSIPEITYCCEDAYLLMSFNVFIFEPGGIVRMSTSTKRFQIFYCPVCGGEIQVIA